MLRNGMFINDRYEILARVGSGGMSDVYKAKCHKLNRYVAIKVLKPEFSDDKNFVTKFRAEAQAAACLSHPNIVSVFDVGEDNGIYYIVMELIEGITLKNYINKKGSLSIKEATSIAIQVAQGIECAHNNHIIHRDIKPQNIIISKEGKVKVADFGIARAASANTINSNAMGSVHYISPEQARGGYVDERSDIYSLGITLYEMITGKLPFEGDSTVSIALKHIQEDIQPMSLYVANIPYSTQQIVQKCTQKKPDNRYLKISTLISDLKKSLLYPEDNFVQTVQENNNNATVMFNPDEIKKIKQKKHDDETYLDNKEKYNKELEDDDFDDLEKLNPKLDKVIKISVIAAGIIFGIIILLVAIKLFGDVNNTDSKTTTVSAIAKGYVKMPTLIDMTEDEADMVLKEKSLGRIFKQKNSDTIAAGKVCEQSIEPDKIIPQNTQITVYVSTGPLLYQLKDIVGKNYEEVYKKLMEANIVVNSRYEYSDIYKANEIISCTPNEGQSLKAGDTIELVVSRGEDTAHNSIVPNVLNKTLDDAKALIISAGLLVGDIKEEESETIEKGIVISNSYEIGSKVPKNTRISLTVSSGPSKVIVPDLGFGAATEKEAKKMLESLNLKLGSITEEYSPAKKGTVIDQSIKPGDTVDRDTEINITISKGEDETTQDERNYKCTFIIKKDDISNGGLINKGSVKIEIDGDSINLDKNYQKVETWPQNDFSYTITRNTGGTAKVKAFVDGKEIWSYNAVLG